MDNLKSLMDQKQYDLVLKLTEHSDDANSLFYRISALLATGRGETALETINNNQKTLESNLPVLMHIHIDLLCLLEHFDEAYEKVAYYQNLPYFSQEAEEILKDLPKIVREEEKKALFVKPLSDDELKQKLISDKQEDVLPALDAVRDREVKNFLPEVQKVLLDFPKQAIRSFALLLLVQKEVEQEVSFKHLDKVIKVVPNKLEPPFVGADFNKFIKELGMAIKDPAVSDNAIHILSSYIIYTYPDKLVVDSNLLIRVLEYISSLYLQVKVASPEETCKEHNLDLEAFKSTVDLIESALEDF